LLGKYRMTKQKWVMQSEIHKYLRICNHMNVNNNYEKKSIRDTRIQHYKAKSARRVKYRHLDFVVFVWVYS
jgi:hypothetical protein